jgi:hypothetical protein
LVVSQRASNILLAFPKGHPPISKAHFHHGLGTNLASPVHFPQISVLMYVYKEKTEDATGIFFLQVLLLTIFCPTILLFAKL